MTSMAATARFTLDVNQPCHWQIRTPAELVRPTEAHPPGNGSNPGPLGGGLRLSPTQQDVLLAAVDEVWLVSKSVCPSV